MKRSYNGYAIDITTWQDEKSGRWISSAKTSPVIAAIYGIEFLGDATKGGFETQEKAETAAYEWAKERIDLNAS